MRNLIKKILREDDFDWVRNIEVNTDLTPAQIKLRYDSFPLEVVGPNMPGFMDIFWEGGKLMLYVNHWEDLSELFVDNDSSQYGYITKWLAEKVLAEDDYWEPYSDVVYDWEEQVWDLVESNPKLLSYVVEHLKDNYVGEVEETITYEDDDVPFDEKLLNHLASQNTAQLGFIIDGYYEFYDLKNELTWAYENAYNTAARDNVWKAAYGALEDIFGKGEWTSFENSRGNTQHMLKFDVTNVLMDSVEDSIEDCFDSCRRYFHPESHFDEEEHENEEEAFEDYCEECIDYPFTDWGSFVSFYRNYLYEADEMLNPSFSEWPDSDELAEYFVDDIYSRI